MLLLFLLTFLLSPSFQQQTFQNTIFDLPAQLGGEPVGVAAQAQGAPTFVKLPDAVPPPAQPAPPIAPPAIPTPAPAFTFPTLAPFTLPSHPTLPPFSIPTHAPFTFPVFTTPAPFVPPSPYQPQQQTQNYQYSGYPQYYNQQQQQYTGYNQQYNQQPYNNYYNNYYNQQVQQPQQPQIQQVPQPQQVVQQIPAQPQIPQPKPIEAQSFESQTQIVQPIRTIQENAQVVQPVLRPAVAAAHSVPTQTVVDTESSNKKAENFNKATFGENGVKPSSVEKASLDAEVDSNLDRHAWFSPDYDVKECRKSLNGIGVKFQKKFPSYLQKGGKDRELSELVEQRLLECERKSTASHWDKVDTLLQKINLTKSEEGECRAGLIQERISCVNLLKYACQFVDSSYHFKLVPARITIQEARQAESGAEKCRQVVRIVKQRLESGAVTL
ncbi:unnamed protein product [Caenorhabditis angaria]|uniref:Uncharacterized protein n=1 Tax=Caenorhabditis angaria TaxID=860376 RepID=A0A9P1IHA0_9PELO|nr:unnamed protein product [Caenorhabditis angaria]